LFIIAWLLPICSLGAQPSEVPNAAFDSISIHSRRGASFEFVYVPPGEYVMGRDIGATEFALRAAGQQGGPLFEGPAVPFELATGFYMGRTQVTAEHFAVFLNSRDRVEAATFISLNRLSNLMVNSDDKFVARNTAERFPANTVTWDGAVAFAQWLRDESGWRIRLPTEREWEAAARGPEGALRPSRGDGSLEIRPGQATVAVDAFPENMSSTGVRHVLNGVGDWTLDIYKGAHQSSPFLAEYRDGRAGHVLKRCVNTLCERQPGLEVGSSGCFGFRLLLEADETGAPLRAPKSARTQH
jgi:formylglycine-generating enzyme required for sulfatase activity